MKKKLVAIIICCLTALCTFALPPGNSFLFKSKKINPQMLAQIKKEALSQAKQKFLGPNAFKSAMNKYFPQGVGVEKLASDLNTKLQQFPQFPKIEEGKRAFLTALDTADKKGQNLRNLLAEMGTFAFAYPKESYPYLLRAADKFDGTYVQVLLSSYLGRAALSDETGYALNRLQEYSTEHELKGPFWEHIAQLAGYRGVNIRVIPEGNAALAGDLIKDHNHDANGLPIGSVASTDIRKVMFKNLGGMGKFPLSTLDMSDATTDAWIALERGKVYNFTPDAVRLGSFSGNAVLPLLTELNVMEYAEPKDKFINTYVKDNFRATYGEEIYRSYIEWQNKVRSFLIKVKNDLEDPSLSTQRIEEIFHGGNNYYLRLKAFEDYYLNDAPSSLEYFEQVLTALREKCEITLAGLKK